jgi:hypothetical protein
MSDQIPLPKDEPDGELSLEMNKLLTAASGFSYMLEILNAIVKK